MVKVSFEKINELFSKISEKYDLFVPSKKNDGQSYFEKWNENTVLSDDLNTVRSAKDFFFPQSEDIVDFKIDGKNIEINDQRREVEPFVIFGVRACDARSFSILDKVFLSNPVDTFYKSKREKGIIISLACSKPAETCFCTTFDIDPTTPEGDIRAWKGNDCYYFEGISEKGIDFLSSLSLEECDSAEVNSQKENTKKILKKLPLGKLDTSDFGGDKLNALFGSEKWAPLSESCLGCGTCTFVCPTCQCYDIKDFDTGHGIKRYRCWDSCMYSDFTKMAHGNPRLSQLERFRQRFMHKLVYFPANNDGEFGCVGCGRCLAKCPISMNIVKVMKTLKGEAK